MYRLILGAFLVGLVAFGQTVELTEKQIVHYAKQQNPTTMQIAAKQRGTELERSSYEEGLGTSLFSSITYADSKEKAIASFIPVFAPSTVASLGVQKTFLHGASVKLSTFADQRSTQDLIINQATRTGAAIELGIDLWKNFLGRQAGAKLDSLAKSEQIGALEANIEQRTYELQMRKIYWSMVANQEALSLTKELENSAAKQLQDAKKRQRSSVADAGEVARFAAQLATRKAHLSALEYQRETLIQSLRESFPELAGNQITLAPYDVEAKVGEVLKCAADIGLLKEIPWEHTPYDEIIRLYEQEYQAQKNVTETHSDIDLQLNSKLQVSGVDTGYGNSYSNLTGSGKFGYEVGLKLTVPLGSQMKSSEEIRADIEKRVFIAKKQQLELKLQSQHTQMVRMLSLLRNSVAAQKQSAEMLGASVKILKRKFRQARATLTDLIREEDSYHSSLLSEIDSKLVVIHFLLDYFTIFTDSPCTINKVG